MPMERLDKLLNIKIPVDLNLIIKKLKFCVNSVYGSDNVLPGFPYIDYSIYFKENDKKTSTWSLYFGFTAKDAIAFTINAEFKVCTGYTISKRISHEFDHDNTDEILISNTIEGWNQLLNENFTNEKCNFWVLGVLNLQYVYLTELQLYIDHKLEKEMEKDVEGKNFTIVVENKELKVHKELLKYHSPVFAAMLEADWKETDENRMEIRSFSYKIVQIAIDLCYGKEYKETFKKWEYVSLFKFADKYDLKELKETVKNGIILTPANVCEYANICLLYKMDELVDKCVDYLIICREKSYSITDSETLDNEIKSRVYDKLFVDVRSPTTKRRKLE